MRYEADPETSETYGARSKIFLALLLGDAAQHGEALAFLVELLVVVQAMEDLLLRLIANGAGVVEDKAGILLGFNLPVALLAQGADHLFGVMGVHLAAEGLQIECFLGCHRHPQYTVNPVFPAELDRDPKPRR